MKLMLIIIILFVVFGGAYFLADVSMTEFQSNYISIVGTAGTFLGLLYTIVQILLLRREAQIVTTTAEDTKIQILLLMCVADWARGIKVAQEVQIHCRNGKKEIAIPRIQELKQILQDIVNSSNGDVQAAHGVTASGQILSLNVIINGFEKDTRSKMSGEQIASVNQTLEATIDLLNEIQSVTKNKG